MTDDAERNRYYDEEEVIGSSNMFHRPSCHLIDNIYRRNFKRFRSWEGAAALGLEPCGICRPFHQIASRPTPPAEPAPSLSTATVVSATILADWRRYLVQLLSALDQSGTRPDSEGVAGRIGRLSHNGIIPKQIAAMMRTVTEMRNAAEYEAKVLSPAESAAVSSAYAAIQEWVKDKDLPSGS